MSLNSPYYKRAVEEADFLRERLFKIQDRVAESPAFTDLHIDYLHTLYALLDKEHSILTRLLLIDTVESHLAVKDLDAWKVITFMPVEEQKTMTPAQLYPMVKAELIALIKEVSGDDWDPDDFDIDDEDW